MNAFRFTIGILVFAAVASGCRQTPPSTDVEIARRIHDLREEAKACFLEYKASDYADIEALECYTARHRETTELMPLPERCAMCYRNYAYGLRLLGIYYFERREDAENELERATGARAEELRNDIAAYRGKVRHYFSLSNQQLERYFRTDRIDPQTWDWASQQYAELGDFKRALRYLNLVSRNDTLRESDRRTLEARRRYYLSELDRKNWERLKDEL